MKNIALIMLIVAGSSICKLSSAANLMVNNITVSESGVVSAIATKLQIRSSIQSSKFLPEVHVGDGNRNGILSIGEDLDASDGTPEDLPKEESES